MTTTRRTLLQTGSAALALTALPGCGKEKDAIVPPAAEGTKPAVNVEDLLSQITEEILTAYPESASSFGIDTGARAGLKAKLTDRSPDGQEKIAGQVTETLKKLNGLDTSLMTDEEALNTNVVRTVYERMAEGFAFPYGDVALLNSNWSYRNAPYAVAQNTGAFVEIPSFLDSSHQIETADDADAYLERMRAYAGQLDGETERVRSAGGMGVVLPEILMKKTLGQLNTGLSTPVADWGLAESISRRTADMPADYTAKAIKIAEEEVLPAIDRQIAALESLQDKVREEPGVWALPQGDEYYDWTLRASTTTDMTADEIHEMGKEELAALHGRMDPILRSIGYTEGSVGARMMALYDDPRYKFSDGDKGRAEIMAFIEEKLTEIRGLMPEAFETLVPGFLEVTRIPVDVEAGAPGAYGGPGSVDGKQPGHFWINLRTPDLHRTFTLQDLTYHEAIPGHVWQGEYTFKQPLIRSLLAFNAYSEGWALYAEQLADELGVYDEFPVGRLGYLQSLAFRACRLVVDTGLHSKRWSRAEAINWFVENNGSNPDEVQSEVDRYCAWPGQACGYKVGHTAIVRLREKAMAELGEAYDFRKFNDAVVLGGSVPMTVLGRVIDDHIAAQKA